MHVAHTAPVLQLPEYSFAFQPIVDAGARAVYSHEALIRGLAGEAAFRVLERVPQEQEHLFDQSSRIVAIELAAELGITSHLNLNFLPRSLKLAEAPLLGTLEAASRHGIPAEKLILEVTEGEVIDDPVLFAGLINEFRSLGIKIAIDDFGSGYSGLNLLADFQPDQIKIDMHLVRGIESHGARQAIARAIIQACADLGIDIIAEGVETPDEYHWLAGEGIHLFQGYLFAKPGFKCLPAVRFPDDPAPHPQPALRCVK